MTQRAIGYGRKSFDDPDHRTASVADQETFARGYAERNGLEFVAWCGDNGITGATMERPGLQQLLAMVVARLADIVIIEDVDRLSRDQEHLQHMSKIFRVHGVVLHTVAAGVIDHLVLSVKGMIGEQQRMRIAYTTRRGLAGKARRGGVTGGKTLGYARVKTADDDGDDRLGIVDDEAALVRRIFKLYADGASLKKICNLLNAEGIPSPRARERGAYNAGSGTPRPCREASSWARAFSTTACISARASSIAAPGSRCRTTSVAFAGCHGSPLKRNGSSGTNLTSGSSTSRSGMR